MSGSGGSARKSMREALEKPEKTTDVAPIARKDLSAGTAAPDTAPPTREIQVVREACRRDQLVLTEEPPTTIELVGFYGYGLCFYFVFAVLLPLLFPLIITQIAFPSSDLPPSAVKPGSCSPREMALYDRLVRHSIVIAGSRLSPLGWTAISWAVGVIVSAPILTQIAHHLDCGQYQNLILIAATTVGSFACLLTGFFKTIWLFPFYILAVVASGVVADAAHTRNYGLMVRGLSVNTSGRQLIARRRAAGSRLSLYVTAAGGVGATLIAAFTYHMLRRVDQFTGLWVVSIFSGLIWFVGICHGLFSSRPGSSHAASSALDPNFVSKLSYAFTLFRYPQAIGSLVAVFLSSFTAMCIFTSGTLYAVGEACIRPVILLSFWILYFIFPSLSLPMLHPVQLLIQADAVRMQLLGFLISAFVSGAGFYFKGRKWSAADVVIVGLVQSTASGVMHAFGRVLLMDCSPAGKEGAFSVWHAWVRAIGACVGFALGSASPGHAGGPLAAAFLASFTGIIALIFGNVSNVAALVGAGHVKAAVEDEKRVSLFSVEKIAGDVVMGNGTPASAVAAEERRPRV